MIVTVKHITTKEIETPVSYPFYRTQALNDDDECIFYKVESPHKITMIHEGPIKTTIKMYDDEAVDFLAEEFTDDFILGYSNYSIIPESVYDQTVNRLIDLVAKA